MPVTVFGSCPGWVVASIVTGDVMTGSDVAGAICHHEKPAEG